MGLDDSDNTSSQVHTDLGAEWTYPGYSTLESTLQKKGFFDLAERSVPLYKLFTPENITIDDNAYEAWEKFDAFRIALVQEVGDVSYEYALIEFLRKNDLDDSERQYLNYVFALGQITF